MLHHNKIVVGFAGLSVLLLAGAAGLQLGQILGAFSVSSPSPVQVASSPSPVQAVSSPSPVQVASSPSPVQVASSPSPVQVVGHSGATPQIASAVSASAIPGSVKNSKSSASPSTGLKPSISSLPPKQSRMMVASLGAGSNSGFLNSNRSVSEPLPRDTSSSGPASQELRERSVIADDFSIFEKAAPIRMDQSVVMAALKQVRQRKTKRRVTAFNRREKKCLARAIYFEARSESRAGQIAVANVIMNRKANRYYPDTVCRVVNQGSERRTGCQFSFRCDGQSDIPREKKPWRSALKIADKVMEGKLRVNRLRVVTHYHAEYVSPKWAKQFRRVAKIGKHIFYVAPRIASYQKW